MYTEKEKRQLERALKRVEKCSGDCKHCEKCHIYTSEKTFCYAIGCDLLPQNMFGMVYWTNQEKSKTGCGEFRAYIKSKF